MMSGGVSNNEEDGRLRRSNHLLGAAIAVLRLSAVSAQPPPAFDVASVRWNKPGLSAERASSRENIETVPGSLIMRNVSMTACLKWAFNVRDDQISGPGWLAVAKYDI